MTKQFSVTLSLYTKIEFKRSKVGKKINNMTKNNFKFFCQKVVQTTQTVRNSVYPDRYKMKLTKKVLKIIEHV